MLAVLGSLFMPVEHVMTCVDGIHSPARKCAEMVPRGAMRGPYRIMFQMVIDIGSRLAL